MNVKYTRQHHADTRQERHLMFESTTECDLNDFDRGMVVGARNSPGIVMQQSLELTQNDVKTKRQFCE